MKNRATLMGGSAYVSNRRMIRMENETLNIDELRQKREQLRRKKKTRITIFAAAAVLLAAVLIIAGVLYKKDQSVINLPLLKEGTRGVITRDKDEKKILNIYLDDMAGSLNPAYMVSQGDRTAVRMVFEPLMEKNAQGVLEEKLIKSLQVSEDGLTYTIKLRKNISFSDGSDLTVRDVMASIAAMAVSGNGGSAAASYERISGMKDYISNPQEFPEGLKESGELELQILFDEASPDNLLVMETLIQKGTFSEDLSDGELVNGILDRVSGGIGTGAYCFTDTSGGSLCTLTANPNYREKIRGIETIEFKTVSYYDAKEAVEEGSFDAALYSGNSQLYETLYDWEGFSVYSKPEETVYVLYFNQNTPALTDEKVRQAITCAFSREGEELKTAERYLTFEEGLTYSTDKAESLGIGACDQDKAKKLLKEAGAENGLSLTLPIAQDSDVQKILAESMKKDLEAVGITLEIRELSSQDYVDTIYLRMDFDLYLTGVSRGDSIAEWKEFYQPAGSLPISVDSEEIFSAYESLSSCYTPEAVESARDALFEIIAQKAPVLVLGRSRNYLSVSADLTGFEATPHLELLGKLHKAEIR